MPFCSMVCWFISPSRMRSITATSKITRAISIRPSPPRVNRARSLPRLRVCAVSNESADRTILSLVRANAAHGDAVFAGHQSKQQRHRQRQCHYQLSSRHRSRRFAGCESVFDHGPTECNGRARSRWSGQSARRASRFTPESIAEVGNFWRAPNMAQAPGLKAVQLFEAIERGEVKFLWIMATNPLVSMPEADRWRRALTQCETVIVSDCVRETDTTQFAQILLPAAGWGEKDGTVTSSERTISRQRAFLPCAGEAKPDWWALQSNRQTSWLCGDAFALRQCARCV